MIAFPKKRWHLQKVKIQNCTLKVVFLHLNDYCCNLSCGFLEVETIETDVLLKFTDKQAYNFWKLFNFLKL